MIELNLRDILQVGQEYVAEFRDEYGIFIKVVKHDVATTSCYEKLDILGGDWTANRIVKAVFFSGKGKLYGITFPELGTREEPKHVSKDDLATILGVENKEVANFRNSFCPEGMEKGTCTPLVPDYVFEDDGYSMSLEKIFVYKSLRRERKPIDISFGGFGEEAHKISVQLSGCDMCDMMEDKLGDKVSFVDFFN